MILDLCIVREVHTIRFGFRKRVKEWQQSALPGNPTRESDTTCSPSSRYLKKDWVAFLPAELAILHVANGENVKAV